MKKILFVISIVLMLSSLLRGVALAQNQTVANGATTAPVNFPGTAGCIYNWSTDRPDIGLPASGTGNIAAFTAVNTGSVPIVATITATPVSLPPYAYIPSQATNNVSVVDVITNKVVAKIGVGNKPYGVAISKDGTRVYITNNNSNSLSVIDATTNTVLTTVFVGKNPEGVVVSPDGSTVFVANTGSNTISVIRTSDYLTINTINVQQPKILAISPDGSLIFVTGITVRGYAFSTSYPYGQISSGFIGFSLGMAVSPDGNKIYTVEAPNNRVTVTQKDGTVFDAYSSYVYSDININPTYNGAGVGGGMGIATSADGNQLYFTSGSSNSMSIINTLTNRQLNIVSLGNNTQGLAVTPNGLIYVINQDSNDISVVDPSSATEIRRFSTGDQQPFALGNFITGNTCNSQPVTYTITVNPQPPTIITADSPLPLTTPAGTASESTLFNVSGINLTEGVLVTAPAGFEVSTDNINFSSSVTIGSGGNMQSTPVYVRLSGSDAIANYTDDIVISSSGAEDVHVTVTGTVTKPKQNIIAGKASGNISACPGSPSASPKIQQFTVSGTLLTGDIVASAPANFEVSLNANSGYGNTVNIINTTGTISNTIVYIRSSAQATGIISGQVTLSSDQAPTKYVNVNGVINLLPVVNPVADQTVTAGTNTAAVNFTGTGNGYTWVNDTPNIGLATSGSGDISAFKAVNSTRSPVTATITVTPVKAALAYVANQNPNSVSVINTLTNQILTNIPVGTVPYATVASADGSTVYVINQNSNNISVINTSVNKVVATLPAGTVPCGMATSPDGNKIYVTNGSSGTVSVISTVTNTIVSSINVGVYPLGIAISSDGSMAYVANRNSDKVSVISTALNSVIASIIVGTSPEMVIMSPDGSKLYVSNYSSSTVSVISTASNTVIANLSTGRQPRGLAISNDGSLLYVTSPVTNSISVINTSTNVNVATIAVGLSPQGISTSPDGKLVYAANFNSNTVSVISTATNKVTATISTPGAPVTFGNFIIDGTGCSGNSTTFKITVDPAKISIAASGTLSALTTTYGTPSASTSFTVSGSNTSEGILVSPPAGFEVSTNHITFSNKVIIGAAGTVPSTTVYLRLAAKSPVNTYSGDIVLSSAGASDMLVPTVTSTVLPATLTITARNKTKIYLQTNPLLTISYNGFVNNEDSTQLTAQPVITTIANNTSPAGQYAITVDGAAAHNYVFNYVQGILIITATDITLIIPNTFTPNGDGINDTWAIKNLDTYSSYLIEVYSRSGQQLYYANSYATPWDGRYNGADLPVGTYYYIINVNRGKNTLSGYVVIIR